MRGHHQRDALRAGQLRLAFAQRVFDAEPLDRATAVVGQLLQRGEIVLS